jgi:hypothetical protein
MRATEEKANRRNGMKVTVDYGTIRGMVVELPEQANVFDVVEAFATAYVKYTMGSGLVSDEVLFSSIGESNTRKAMRGGVEQRLSPEDYETVKDVLFNDDLWKLAVLKARYGKEQGELKFIALDPESPAAMGLKMAREAA